MKITRFNFSTLFRERVKETIKKYGLLERGERIVVALSGGIDSMVLLHVLLGLAPSYFLDVVAAHFNHGIRGKESDRDEEFVGKVCKEWGVTLEVGRGDIHSIKSERGMGVEDAAREARYAFLRSVLAKRGADKLAVAHTKSDAVETFLMRLIKGASPYGLRGISPRRDEVIRPLIEHTREDVERYMKAEGIPFVEDSTNKDMGIFRNWVRWRLLPILKERNPKVEEALSRFMEIWREESHVLEDEVERFLNHSLKREGRDFILPSEGLLSLPSGLKRRVLLKVIHSLGADALWTHVTSLMRLVEESRGAKELHLPGGLRVWKEYDNIRFLPLTKGGGPSNWQTDADRVILLVGEGIYHFGGYLFQVKELGSVGEKVARTPWSLLLDRDKVDFPLLIRYKRPGDVIYLNKVGHKKLQDVFVDGRVPYRERLRPVLVDRSGRILWVPGLRHDSRFLSQKGTSRFLLVTAKRGE